jgi:hypothetical protein
MTVRQLSAALGIGALAWYPPLAYTPAQAASDPTAWFQSTTQALMDAVTSGDKSVWEKALETDCMITNEDGEVLTKTRMVQEVEPLPAGFSGAIKVRDLTVRTLADAAVVHYWLDESEQIFGQALKTVYVETDVYRRSGDTWKAVAMHVTVVPRDLEPVPIDASGWPQLLGDYAYSEQASSRYHVFMRGNALFGGTNEKTATRLIPLSPLVYFQQGSIHTLIFVRDGSGAIAEVREIHKYNEVRMKRVAAQK